MTKMENNIANSIINYDQLGNLTESIINDKCSIFKRIYSGKLLIEEIHYWPDLMDILEQAESGISRYEYEKNS